MSDDPTDIPSGDSPPPPIPFQRPDGSAPANGGPRRRPRLNRVRLALILVPFIPGVRSIPRKIPLYRLIWRDYYTDIEGGA